MPGGASIRILNSEDKMDVFTKKKVRHQAVLLYLQEVKKRDALGLKNIRNFAVNILYPVLEQQPNKYHEEITKLVTNKYIARRSKTEQKRIYEGYVLEHGYHRQIFVHNMNTNNHELKCTNSKIRKLAASQQLDEVQHVITQTTIDIAETMFYAFHQFHLLPHGGCCRLTQQSSEKVILSCGNNRNGSTVYHIRMDIPKNVSHNCARVLYPGSTQLDQFENCGLDKAALLDYVLKKGKFKKKSRDSGFARRITMGWTRKQTSTHPKTKYYKGIQLPLMNTKAIDSMSPSLKLALSKILLKSNETLLELFSDKNPLPFSDKKRNTIYGNTFTSLFCKKYASSFEFVDLFVESGGNLNRHMDYQNSERSGYDYGCSYSYLITKNKTVYRVNIIMCSRKTVDQSVDELKRNGKYV